MFGLLRKWRERRAEVRQAANSLIARHGDQARHVLRERIQACAATGEPTKRLWAILKEVRQLTNDDGLDTATRLIERK
jgi:hypothetical protein